MQISNQNTPESAHESDLFRQGYPWRLVLDLNEECNLKCNYCHIDSKPISIANLSKTLPPEQVKRVLSDANRMKVFDITLTGGEVTIMPNITEYLEQINDLDFSSVQIITNGTMLATKGLARKIKELGVSRVSVSLDGPKNSHDKARGNGTWERAMDGIKSALDADLPVNVISVLGAHNLEDWDLLSPTLKEMGVRSQNISLMCRRGRAEKNDVWNGVPENRLGEIQKKQQLLESKLNDDTFFTYFNDGVLKHPGWDGKTTPLHAFQDQNPGIEAVINVDGNVKYNRLYGMQRIIGNIGNTALSKIWDDNTGQRSSLRKIIGTENVGNLPDLYYHYKPNAIKTIGHNITSQTPLNSNSLRIRQEEWGDITFDPSIFSITDISIK